MAQMGIGELGRPNIIIKRKFRFTVEFETPVGTVERHFVKMAARPHLDVDETEVNFLNGWMTIPGRGKWQPITVTYYDVAHAKMKQLYDWVASVYDFSREDGGIDHLPQSEKAGWAAKGIISMYDGCGLELERWTLFDCWPQSVNFGDIDYSNSEEATIDLTIKYRYARLQGINCVPSPVGQCKGCDGNLSQSGQSDPPLF